MVFIDLKMVFVRVFREFNFYGCILVEFKIMYEGIENSVSSLEGDIDYY